MALQDRDTLKNYFRQGSVPSELHFQDLIDSTVNKVDDGLDKDLNNGLQLSPRGRSKNVMSFFESFKDKTRAWNVSLNPDPRSSGIGFSHAMPDQEAPHFPLFIAREGGIGVGTARPQHLLDVQGVAGMQGRVGTFKQGSVPADGKWHDIVTGLDQVHAFEIMALANGKKHTGKYAITHAIALAAFGSRRSRNKVRHTRAFYSWFWNAISLRWKGSTFGFSLQIRTRSNYGLGNDDTPAQLHYRVMKLWDEQAVQW